MANYANYPLIISITPSYLEHWAVVFLWHIYKFYSTHCMLSIINSIRSILKPLFSFFFARFYHVCKDFCGVVNEQSIRANVLLIYELLDEYIVSVHTISSHDRSMHFNKSCI